MPRRGWRLRVEDMLRSIRATQRYVADLDYAAFAADELLVDAVIRQLTILGEAAVNVDEAVRNRHPEVPWDDLRGMRNVVVHVYFGTRVRTVWWTATARVPPLEPLLEALLADEDAASPPG